MIGMAGGGGNLFSNSADTLDSVGAAVIPSQQMRKFC